MGLCITVVLTIALFRVTNSTRRLYDWSMNVAASAATAQADADAARIAALQAQMNPHFLFNALNTIASLVGADGARSQRTVQNLTGMLKHTLERSSKPLTTVDDEIQFVRDYLDIERERFGSRLQVTYAVDPAIGTMPVPTMSLQPLVENAIKHAVASRLEGGHIRIKAARRLDRPAIRLTVEDDGPGFGPDTPDGTGLGNLRARLHTLYGSDAMLLTETLPQGARVMVTVPISADAWLPCAS
jgi:LytS/YehU family sensor histidine kinase